MKAPYDVTDPESGELLIEIGDEVSAEGFYALVASMAKDRKESLMSEKRVWVKCGDEDFYVDVLESEMPCSVCPDPNEYKCLGCVHKEDSPMLKEGNNG